MNDICVLCFEEITPETRHILNPCNHCIHTACVIDWYKNTDIEEHNNCPVCRQTIFTESSNIYKNYVFNSNKNIRLNFIRNCVLNKKTCPAVLKKYVKQYDATKKKHLSIVGQLKKLKKTPAYKSYLSVQKKLIKFDNKLIVLEHLYKNQLTDIMNYPVLPVVKVQLNSFNDYINSV